MEKIFYFGVSVRLMTFNHESYIQQAMDSIMMQKTTFPIQVVVGDDFSTDHTLAIIKSYSDTANITIKVLNRNQGDEYSINRNKKGRLYNYMDIISHCEGKYIAILDGDDAWGDEFKLQKQWTFLENHPDFYMHFHDSLVVDEENNVLREGRVVNRSDVRQKYELVRGSHVPTNTVMFRNSLPPIPDDFYKVMNADTFLFALIGQLGMAKFDPSIKPSLYRMHSSSVWSSISKKAKTEQSYNTSYHLTKYIKPQYHVYIYRKRLSIIRRGMRLAGCNVRDQLIWLPRMMRDFIHYTVALTLR